ncbi:serine/threonine-protein kinase [Gluconobacter morbifer]|uniref:Protein kinase domain-containing protein n=1 Tax=Gluconobacter morbifer G707 TaxID=1088869 RepID=G6XMP1_9PROT|nr:hypothetical protein [Gluconobacter morbifer]EHH66940.1 hypothetical protein GMO_27590 [Gluconobacter morbifer G707]
MAYQNRADSPELVIAERYLVNPDRKQPGLGGCPACSAQDISASGASYLALAPVAPSPRLDDILRFRHENLVPIHAYEYQEGALWVICPNPPGPPLTDKPGIWTEGQLIDGVIRPLANLLQALQDAGIPCRAIRPDNLFLAQGIHRLILGPLGLTPPAEKQPVLFEPLSAAVCVPAARGEGTLPCDIFSLGVLILMLATGRRPLEGLSDVEILKRRFDMGTAAAYMDGQNIPPGLVSLLEAMLADQPDSRPSPWDLSTIAPNKLFTIHPEIPARAPLLIGGVKVRTPRALAWYAGQYPAEFSSLLQRRIVSQWLYRELERSAMGSLIEQISTPFLSAGTSRGGDAATMTLTRAIAILDPAAPMFWGGRWFWPDALPQMLVQCMTGIVGPEESRNIQNMTSFLISNPDLFEALHLSDLMDEQMHRVMMDVRRAGLQGTEQVRRLPYDWNRYLICLSSRCLSFRISLPGGLLGWLEHHTGEGELPQEVVARTGFLDEQMRLFLDSHYAEGGIIPLSHAQKAGLPLWLSDLTLMAAAQRHFDKTSLRTIAGRALPLLEGELNQWRSRTNRAKRRDALVREAKRGDLTRFLSIVNDVSGLREDQRLAAAAEEEILHLQELLVQEPAQRTINDRRARDAGEFFSLLAGIAVAMASVWLEFCQ